MRTAETIIAVNTDPEAPIFGVAHYGAVIDMFELADELEAQLALRLTPCTAADRRERDAAGLLALRHLAEGGLVRAGRLVGVRVRLRRRAADRELPPRARRAAAAGPGAGGALLRGLPAVLSQRTIARRDRTAGLAHAAIFYGFLTLFAGTVILGFETDFTEPVFGWSYFHGGFYLAYKEVLNLLGTALIAGAPRDDGPPRDRSPRKLDYARPDRAPGEPQFDRRRLPPRRLGVRRDPARDRDHRLRARGRADRDGPPGLRRHPVRRLGRGAGPHRHRLHRPVLAGLRHGLWWFHGLLAITFVASIPYTKAAHMIASYVSLSLRDPLAGKRLAPIAPERADEPAGYGALADFSPRHLIQLDACTKCGRCHEACPAYATGRPLSPRDVILELREQANHARPASGSAACSGRCCTRRRPATATAPVTGHDGVRAETAWACMQCNACVEICPVGIEQAPIINQLRRRLVEEGEIDPTLQATLQTIHKSGNSFGENRRKRGRWTEQLDFEVKDARKEPVEVLWFVGDYASFDPRSQRVSRALARILQAAGVDFGILYDGERNAGNDVRRVGEEGLFESLAEHNIETLSGCEFERIVTSDPHSLNTLRNEYPDLGGSWPVDAPHRVPARAARARAARAGAAAGHRVTYHDPCYLGRHNGGYDAPRAILERLGCTLVEMPRNRDNSFCCGAGGGRIWIPDTPGQERPSENRIREAVGLDGVELFVVACPKDVTMYEDAIKTSGNAGRIELRELTELIEEALRAGGGRRAGRECESFRRGVHGPSRGPAPVPVPRGRRMRRPGMIGALRYRLGRLRLPARVPRGGACAGPYPSGAIQTRHVAPPPHAPGGGVEARAGDQPAVRPEHQQPGVALGQQLEQRLQRAAARDPQQLGRDPEAAARPAVARTSSRSSSWGSVAYSRASTIVVG